MVTFLVLLQVIVPTLLTANSLADQIAEIVEKPASERAFWGVQVVDLEDGQILYERHQNKLFVPASNSKLFSTAAALSLLGHEYFYGTVVASKVSIDGDGTLDGDLVLVGGGDPNLSSRLIPYNPKQEFVSDRLSPLRELARQVSLAGIRKITGDVIGDDRRYVWQRRLPGWSTDDEIWGYGAPISALSFNDNSVSARVLPGDTAGASARIVLRPDVGYFRLDNRLQTAVSKMVPRGLNLERLPGSRGLALWGEISIYSRGRKLSIAVNDPALFAAHAFHQALSDIGIRIEGSAVSQHAFGYEFPSLKRVSKIEMNAYPTEIAAISSSPLAEIVKVVNKLSQNLHAEMLLREIGWKHRGVGSYQAGLGALAEFLQKEVGLDSQDFFLLDASGLSRHNLVSPAAIIKLLTYMWRSPSKEVFLASLPIAGKDGTLDWRFSRTPARGRIRAKTGTLSHVTTIAGYISTADQRDLAFSIMVNNYGVQASYVRNLVDKVCILLAESKKNTNTQSSLLR